MQRLFLILGGLAVLGYGLWYWFAPPDPSKMYVFNDISGPSERTVMPAPRLAAISDYEKGSAHRLAILVTDETSGWLGLVRAFRAHGIPITVTADPEKALAHKVVLVYPIISGRALTGETLRALSAHMRDGGTILTFNLAGGGLEELFGVSIGVESLKRSEVTWTMPRATPQESKLTISRAGEDQMGSIGYAVTTAQAEATFDDGSAAIACREAGGKACVMGIELGVLAQRAMNGRAETLGQTYVNGFTPTIDVFVRWIRDLYVAGEPMPFIVSPAPAGKDVSIILSHDVDFTRSVTNSGTYADALSAAGAAATFFVQTKYVKDYNDDIFFNDTTVPQLKALADKGMQIESHSVAHSRTFDKFDIGSGRERYPRYMPFVKDRTETTGGTVLGELRVSQYLLTTLLKSDVRAFRPGHLVYPFALPQALEATGYKYSSSITANATLTHLPFQLTDDRANGALTSMYEFPVTIEDEQPPELSTRLEAAQELIENIARYNGIAVVLMHPDVVEPKLGFERAIIEKWKDRAWIGPVTAFGDWWRARDLAEVDLTENGGVWTITAGGGGAIADLEILLPKSPVARHDISRKAGERAGETIAAAVQP
ncbi:MAG: polysaccharide deacetylase family protein [Proteobacteria bacterium]|nr:polysaccharide deacetylase family protein [Pseudomonadota bacterium]